MENDFAVGDAGSAGIEKVSAGSLKKGSLVMIKGRPCKVVDFSTAKTGKHGAAKAMITGIDLFTAKKLECTYSTGETVDAPVATKTEYNLLNIDDEGFVSLMQDSGEIKEDLKLPEGEDWLKDVVAKIKEIFEAGKNECLVTVLKIQDQEKIISVREGAAQ